MKVIYHYTIRYSYRDKKKQETGHGIYPYALQEKLYMTDFAKLEAIEKKIAKKRHHEEVSVSCFSLKKAEVRR